MHQLSDLMTMDIHLPGIEGIEAVRRIRGYGFHIYDSNWRGGLTMKRSKRMSQILMLLLVTAMMLLGCSLDDAAYDADEMEEQLIVCESFEVEVEPGVCSYIVECDDAESCEAWSAGMIENLEASFGDLTYAEEWDIDEEDSNEEEDTLVSYQVHDNEIVLVPENEEEEYYAWLWSRFAWIIPSEERSMITNYEVYDHADTMAYVVQNDDDYEEWTYATNQIQATYEMERIMTDIHEFGHLMSLNSNQLDPYERESNCDTHMFDEGCAREDAYIYSFYKQFWEHGNHDDENDFVTEYASSDVYEDFAESWSYFVITPRPLGDALVDRKIAFFYNYEELIQLKANILGRVASWVPRNVEDE